MNLHWHCSMIFSPTTTLFLLLLTTTTPHTTLDRGLLVASRLCRRESSKETPAAAPPTEPPTETAVPASGWIQVGADIDGEAELDFSGQSVSLSADGTRVAIGAHFNDGNGYSNIGHVRVYDYSESDDEQWSKLGWDLEGEFQGDNSGFAVALSGDGNRVAIGAILNAGRAGHVRVYEWKNDFWIKIGSDLNSVGNSANFGYSVSFSYDGNRLAVGSPFFDADDKGVVQVYDYDEGLEDWVQAGGDLLGTQENDNAGYAVALSWGGTRVAVGAPYTEGSEPGTARIYDWNATSATWLQLGDDLEGEFDADQSGSAIALSADGSVVAVGAPRNDGAGTDSGHVRVYAWWPDQGIAGEWVQLIDDINGPAAGACRPTAAASSWACPGPTASTGPSRAKRPSTTGPAWRGWPPARPCTGREPATRSGGPSPCRPTGAVWPSGPWPTLASTDGAVGMCGSLKRRPATTGRPKTAENQMKNRFPVSKSHHLSDPNH